MREGYRVGGLTMNTERFEVRVDGGPPIHLTPAEWGVLLRLARDPGVVLSGDQLLGDLQYENEQLAAAATKVYVHRIRQKIGDLGPPHRFLHNHRGFGWMLEDRPRG